jgi:hypothetical protein
MARFELSECLDGRALKGFPQDIAGSNLLTRTGVPDGSDRKLCFEVDTAQDNAWRSAFELHS